MLGYYYKLPHFTRKPEGRSEQEGEAEDGGRKVPDGTLPVTTRSALFGAMSAQQPRDTGQKSFKNRD